MNELLEWLQANKIQYTVIDSEVVELPGFGKLYYEDTEKLNSIFRLNKDGELVFNSMEEPSVLLEEGIQYITFKFGDNWYYFDLEKGFALNILKYVGTRAEVSKKDIQIVNLGVHTPFELLNGSFMPEMWVRKAKFLGHQAIGICDRNTMAACYNLQKCCNDAGIKFVFGYSLTFKYGDDQVGAKVYVSTQKGLRNLLRIQKAIMVDSEDQMIEYEELKVRGEGNIIVFDKLSSPWIIANKDAAIRLANAFDNSFFQVDLTEYKAERIDIRVLEAAKLYFDNLYETIAPVLITDAYYLDRSDAKNKLILNKIATGAAHEQSGEQFFKDVDEHYELFQELFDPEHWDVDEIFAECVDNANFIADQAEAKFENDRNFMPKYTMTEEEERKYGTVHNMFNQLLEEGFERLVPKDVESQEKYRNQMEYEKYIIESTNNVDYLLVQYDTCNWSRQNNILVGCGRGSAAGSLLLYLLGITLIDPLRYNLIFERFLLPERAGLYPSSTTIIGEDIESSDYVEVALENGKTLKLDKDAQLYVKREGEEEPITIYADELQEGDDILFDNKDELFTINEL
ncbi:MAG: PHP domain-containing protein [Bacteroidales bacterium]|nr:PHP domain-containing protein [Bacteroidales bacterium]